MKKRILVVEDEAGIAMALEDDLRHQGYEVVMAGDGDAALRAAREGGVDAILLDVMLPKRDGLSVCRELRSAGVRTPIILLTARTQDAEKLLGFESGADDYVTKPYSPPELHARLKALLRRAGEDVPATYHFGEVDVNFDRREVQRQGAVLALTPLEFRLLTTFVEHRGRALSRQRLIDEAWGHDTFVTDRVVDNQVTNLRKKVELQPSRPVHIQSIRGFGYRFDG